LTVKEFKKRGEKCERRTTGLLTTTTKPRAKYSQELAYAIARRKEQNRNAMGEKGESEENTPTEGERER